MQPIVALALIGATLAADFTQRPARTLHQGPQEGTPPPAAAVYYERVAQGVATGAFAAMLRALSDEARQDNRLLFEEHEVELVSEMELKQSYLQWFRPGFPRYSFAIDLKLGAGRLLKSHEQHDALLWKHEVLADDESSGVTAQQLADYLDRVAADLDDGILFFEGNQLEIGETLDLFIYHTVGGNKGANGVQIGARFGETVPLEHKPRLTWQELYRRESESLSMQEVGRILERLGREIHQRGSVSLGGIELAVGGDGSFELVSRADPSGSKFFQIEFLSGREGPSDQKEFYVPYERRSHGWAPSDVARSIDEVAETLARTGSFVMEDDTVALDGPGSIEQRIVERFDPGIRRYAFYLNISFGPKDLPTPLEEYVEQLGSQEVLVKDETRDIDGAALGRLLSSVSRDLEQGQLHMGGQELAASENVDFRFKHTSSTDGSSHRIQIALFFGERVVVAGVAPGAIPRSHARESRNMSMHEIAALFQRMGTEILSDGSFSVGDTVFRTAEQAYFEIKVIEGRGLEIGVSYVPPPLVP